MDYLLKRLKANVHIGNSLCKFKELSPFSHEIYSVYLFSWRNQQVHNCEDIQLYSFIYYTDMFLSIFNNLQGVVQ